MRKSLFYGLATLTALAFNGAAAQDGVDAPCQLPALILPQTPPVAAIPPFTRTPYGEPVNRPFMNAPVTAFMDVFWDRYEIMSAIAPPATLGESLDLAKRAFLKAYDLKGANALAKGITPVLTFESSTRGDTLNARHQRYVTVDFGADHLRAATLADDARLLHMLGIRDRVFDTGFDIAVRFDMKYDHMIAFVAQGLTKKLENATMDTPMYGAPGTKPDVAAADQSRTACLSLKR